MLAPPDGNMRRVYLRTEQQRKRKIARDAESHINAAVSKARPIEAEITEGAHADWYLVHTFPGDDVRAMRWLARRRFGVFRPMQQREDKRRSIKLQGWEAAFPGWLFVYVWDIAKMRDRILATPGVMGMLYYPDTTKPFPVNQQDKKTGEYFIDKLRDLSWVYNENAPRLTRHVGRLLSTPQKTKRVSRRPSKQERKLLDRLKNDFKARNLEWDQATWDHANRLDPHHRIALLQRTLLNAPSLQVVSGA